MSSDVRTGTVVAGFRVERLIGEAAMGSVYLGLAPVAPQQQARSWGAANPDGDGETALSR
jgi:hypothetical protein